MFEGIVLILSLATLISFYRRDSVIRVLANPTDIVKTEIHEIIDLEKPAENKAEVKSGDARKDKNKKQERDLNNQKRLTKLYGKYKKNWIGNDTFYSWNQIFFMFGLLFYTMQAMAFPSCSELITMVFVLVMLAFFPIRKSVGKAYREFVFFVMYWIAATLNLKLFYRVLIRVAFIRSYIRNHRGLLGLKILTVMWGDITDTNADKKVLAKLER
jgi:hypothetical protein